MLAANWLEHACSDGGLAAYMTLWRWELLPSARLCKASGMSRTYNCRAVNAAACILKTFGSSHCETSCRKASPCELGGIVGALNNPRFISGPVCTNFERLTVLVFGLRFRNEVPP